VLTEICTATVPTLASLASLPLVLAEAAAAPTASPPRHLALRIDAEDANGVISNKASAYRTKRLRAIATYTE